MPFTFLLFHIDTLTFRDDTSKPGIAVHHTLDFVDNKITNDGNKIREIILRKSGRIRTDDTLYLVVDDFNVYLRSLKVELERLPFPGHPPRSLPRVPWSESFYTWKISSFFYLLARDYF